MELVEFLEKLVDNSTYDFNPFDTIESIEDRISRCREAIRHQEDEINKLENYICEKKKHSSMIIEAKEFLKNMKEK